MIRCDGAASPKADDGGGRGGGDHELSAILRNDSLQALRAVDAADDLLARVPAERIAAHPELRTILLHSRGSAHSRLGALDDAVAALRDGAASSPGCETLRLACLEQLALVNAYLAAGGSRS